MNKGTLKYNEQSVQLVIKFVTQLFANKFDDLCKYRLDGTQAIFIVADGGIPVDDSTCNYDIAGLMTRTPTYERRQKKYVNNVMVL